MLTKDLCKGDLCSMVIQHSTQAINWRVKLQLALPRGYMNVKSTLSEHSFVETFT